MSKLFTDGKTFEIQPGWLVSKDEIQKNDQDRTCYIKREVMLQNGAVLWRGEFEWLSGEIRLVSYVDGNVRAHFEGLDFRTQVLASSKTNALEKLENKLREKEACK